MPATTKTIIRKVGYVYRWRIIAMDHTEIATGTAQRWRGAKLAARDARRILLEEWPNQKN